MQNVAKKNGKLLMAKEMSGTATEMQKRKKNFLIKLRQVFSNFPHLLRIQRGRCSSRCQTRANSSAPLPLRC